MAFAASILLVVTIFAARVAHEFDTTGERVQGEVIRFIDYPDGTYRAVFRFPDAHGQIYEATDSITSSGKRFEIGEKVSIVYDGDDPSSASEDSAILLYLLPLITGVMSILFFGGAALVWRLRARFQKDYEARRGKTIVTTVNSDGSVTQTTHSSVPVFRWTGFFLASLGIVAWLGALRLTLPGFAAVELPQRGSLVIFLVVVGSLLLLGATASLRHAKFLQELE